MFVVFMARFDYMDEYSVFSLPSRVSSGPSCYTMS
jgi:hypothetical protein